MFRLKDRIKDIGYRFLVDHYPRVIIDHRWKRDYGYSIDWNNPRDLNEKIQWLICYGDTSLWPILADKYLVRDYVKSKGLGHLLPELYGVWEDANDIDFNTLPDKFVLKCNHDSGSTHIVDKAKGYSKEFLVRDLNDHLRYKFGYRFCEPHYNKIHPKIIAEQVLFSEKDSAFSSSLVDYKVWCFNGKPYSVWVCYNRDHDKTYVNEYDLEWIAHPEYSVFTDHYRDGHCLVPKPEPLSDMLEIAGRLSEGQPEVRVDFYIVDGRLYFGEMTLTSNYGRMAFYTKDYLIELGDQVKLPER